MQSTRITRAMVADVVDHLSILAYLGCDVPKGNTTGPSELSQK